MDKRTKRTIAALVLVSVCIYLLQLVIFHDPHNTFFYILQDMAFMPFTIAIATIVVGEVMNSREKKERVEKTRMLTSSFFTELGAGLMQELLEHAEYEEDLEQILHRDLYDEKTDQEQLQKKVLNAAVKVNLTEESYSALMRMITERQTMLLVISSNPVLLDHECFTDLLWGIFHLIDEYRLRGEYQKLSEADLVHLEHDFETVLRLLIVNWITNVRYMKQTYPNFFGTARSRLERDHR